MGKGIRYPEEFKADAVALVRQGVTQTQVCRDLGVSKSALSKWRAQAEAVDHGIPAGQAADPQVRELMKRNRLLEQENEVLRRAAAYLGQAGLPKN